MNSYFFFKNIYGHGVTFISKLWRHAHIVSIRLKRCNTILRWCVADGQRETLLKNGHKWTQPLTVWENIILLLTFLTYSFLKPFIEPDVHIEFLVFCRSFLSSKMVATSNELHVCLPVVIYVFVYLLNHHFFRYFTADIHYTWCW